MSGLGSLVAHDRTLPQRLGERLPQSSRGDEARGEARRALPGASAGPAALPSYCFSTRKDGGGLAEPRPQPPSRRPSLLASTRSPARGLGGPKSAVARVPGLSAAASGRGGAMGGTGAGPCYVPWTGVRGGPLGGGWTDGLRADGCRAGWPRGGRVSQPHHHPESKGSPGCGAFSASVESFVSKLGSCPDGWTERRTMSGCERWIEACLMSRRTEVWVEMGGKRRRTEGWTEGRPSGLL